MDEAGTANLEKVDHIVVLMLENRSFDHMLGYLSLEGGRSDVDGLREGMANQHQGRRYPIHHLRTTVIAEDPDHSASSVDLQIGGGKMDGFVASYAATMESLGVKNGDPAPIMGYFHAADVPVYDHLASEFAVCDRWFSSVPGATYVITSADHCAAPPLVLAARAPGGSRCDVKSHWFERDAVLGGSTMFDG